ncbi:MAG: YbbR-like domain-containing protein [Lutibacter sp.]|uniref:CdaR family protein n=1 Tax=Lutibacter sp. TaxID=1925666 RepID=UPI00385EECAA
MNVVEKQTNLSITTKRKAKVFLFILVLTSIIWLLIELSKISTSTAEFNVEYTNIPVNKLLQRAPISKIEIALKAPGFSLLEYKLNRQKIVFNLKNSVKSGYNYYLLPNQQLAYLNQQFSGETEVISVLIDTVFLELGINKIKKVPVNPSLDIKFKLGYNLTDTIKIIPDSVLVSGSEKFIDSIQEISTSVIKLHDVYKNINVDLDLKLPDEKYNLLVSTTKVKIVGEVEKFTEGKFKIPVTIINKPEKVVMNTFPREIEVIYQAGLSNFNKITTNSFLIVYDYEEYKNDTLIKYLTPVIQQKSEFISSLKIHPAQIEFLIQR